jgi:glutamate N-acetyltransferase (EC 2.3.1.35)
MPVGGVVALTLKAISGIRIGTASAGISQTIRDDVTVFELAADTQVAAVFTKNKFVLRRLRWLKTPQRIDR